MQMANLIDTLQAEGTFTTFTRAIKMTEIVAALREPGAYTLFAPTDAAFALMKADQVEDLFEDYEDMSKLVKYHLVLGIYRTTALLDMIFLKTMEGQRLTIASSATNERDTESLVDGSDAHGYVVRDTVTSTLLESIKVNGAHITRGNVSADNGIMHVIDKVLVPRFMVI
jgi:uncharacterized surface protein with fasciclin (FAS1) repeats